MGKKRINHKTLVSSFLSSRNGKVSKVAKFAISGNFAKGLICQNGEKIANFAGEFQT